MTDTERIVTACPSCDSTNVFERATKTPPWRCSACGHEFDEPHERPARPPGGAPSAPATPDHAFVDVEPGDKLRLTKAETHGYHSDHVVTEIRERTMWTVPFGDDWVDAEVLASQNAASGTEYRVRVRADGSVDVYRPVADEPVHDARKHVASIASVSQAGRVSRTSFLAHFVDEERRRPEGDDSWQDLYETRGESA